MEHMTAIAMGSRQLQPVPCKLGALQARQPELQPYPAPAIQIPADADS